MEKVHFFTLRFRGFTVGNGQNSGYLRITTRDRSFYTNTAWFKEPALFDQLTPGDIIHIGTHQLADGSYWIHWVTDGNIVLEPAGSRPALLLPVLRIFAGIPAFFVVVCSMFYSSNIILIMVLFLAITLMLLFYGLTDIHAICLRFSSRVRELLEKLELAKQGDTTFCEDAGKVLVDPTIPAEMPEGFANLAPHLEVIKNTVTSVNYEQWDSHITDNSGAWIRYVCQRKILVMHWRSGDPVLRREVMKIMPFFYKAHIPFVAEGDRLLTVFNREGGTVQGSYNYHDGSAYFFNGNWYRSDRIIASFYKMMFFIFAPVLTLSFLTLFIGFSIADGKFATMNWGFVQPIVSVMFLTVGAVTGLTDLAMQFTRLLSTRVQASIQVRKALSSLREQQQRSAYIQEV